MVVGLRREMTGDTGGLYAREGGWSVRPPERRQRVSRVHRGERGRKSGMEESLEVSVRIRGGEAIWRCADDRQRGDIVDGALSDHE